MGKQISLVWCWILLRKFIIMKPGQLKEVIKKEYQKCAKDPIYFLKKYCVVQHPIRGKVPFHLYEYQPLAFLNFSEL